MEAKLVKIFLQTTAEGETTKQELQNLAVQGKHVSSGPKTYLLSKYFFLIHGFT
jgi:hypothetical protein